MADESGMGYNETVLIIKLWKLVARFRLAYKTMASVIGPIKLKMSNFSHLGLVLGPAYGGTDTWKLNVLAPAT